MSRLLAAMPALLVLFVLLDHCRAGNPAPGTQVGQTFVSPSDAEQQINYLLFLPCDYCRDPNHSWPLMLFLHGSGERGTCDLPLVRKHGPPKLVETDKDFPFIVVSPQCPKEANWNDEARMKLLIDLLEDLSERFRVDANHISVTGLSMGGAGAWGLAAAYPNRISAIVPMCGAFNVAAAGKLKAVPTWYFEGEDDKPSLLDKSRELVDAIKAAGGQVRTTYYPDVGHNCWDKAYDTPELYKWLQEQSLKSRFKSKKPGS